MTKASKLCVAALMLTLALCFSVNQAGAATVTRYIEFDGAAELWNWTATGLTKIGQPVTAGTLPSQMADPAKLSWFNYLDVLQFEYRSYRPTQYTQLNNWKTGITRDLVSFNLSGSSAGTGSLPIWGETVAVTVGSQPTPDDAVMPPGEFPYDNVGTSWFAQTNGSSGFEPQWWCETQADAIDKAQTGAFVDVAEYTFDDSYLNLGFPDTLNLWIGGYVTSNLSGVVNEPRTASYGILEGLMKPAAYTDEDGDGHYPDKEFAGIPPVLDDCDDDDSDDPSECATCTDCADAAQPQCAGCARCMFYLNPLEWAGDVYDTNCNGQLDCFIATTSFDKVNSNMASLAVLAMGIFALGLVLRRRESIKGIGILLIAVGLAGVPITASADEAPQATAKAVFMAALDECGSCGSAVEMLIRAGYPEADVIHAALAGCKEGDAAEIITSAIKAGGEPFTVAHVAKNAGVDLKEVVVALKQVDQETGSDEVSSSPFPPSPPVSAAGVPVILGTGSTWGSSKLVVASPSL